MTAIPTNYSQDDRGHEWAIQSLCLENSGIYGEFEIKRLYAEQLALLAVGARILTFLPILTLRKVRNILDSRYERNRQTPEQTFQKISRQAAGKAVKSMKSVFA